MPELCVFQLNAKPKPSYIPRCGIELDTEPWLSREQLKKTIVEIIVVVDSCLLRDVPAAANVFTCCGWCMRSLDLFIVPNFLVFLWDISIKVVVLKPLF